MEIGQIFHDLVFDYTLRTVALGSAVLGLVSGALGAFAVLRKQSLLGDTISHTALPGIALAFLLTESKAPLVMIIGAALAGWLGTLFILKIVQHTRLKIDSAMGMVLSVFFGFGLVLLTFIQRLPTASKAGLDKFLFGQASALLVGDVITMSVVGGVVLLVLVVFWKEMKLLSFDPDFGQSMGFPVRRLDILVVTLIVIAIVIGLQTVGVVLMSAMVVAPAAGARQWTDRLSVMVILSAVFGAAAGISGAVISSLTTRLPTGPTIVLCISTIVIISLLLAPNRGLVARWLRNQRRRHIIQVEAVLTDLMELASQHSHNQHPHSLAALQTMSYKPEGVQKTLKELEQRGWVRLVRPEEYALTPEGVDEARKVTVKMEPKT